VYRPATSNETEIIYMTREDKPDLPDERARVERMGGRVYIPDRVGSTPRVIYYDRSTGSQSGLAMSRSIGDWDAGRVGVIPSPIVDVVDLDQVVEKYSNGKDDDDVHIFAVSASDGMMDFLDSETIASVLAASLFDENSDHPLTACERLISIAAASWQRAKEGRYRDDIALAVSKLRTPAPGIKKSAKEEL
jgi:serine/threonine protein phosphatase PrpC